MKKLFVLRIIVLSVFILVYSKLALAQDSVKKAVVTKAAAVKTSAAKPVSVNPSSKHHVYVNKLVQGVKIKYYPGKSDEEVAAIIYANPEIYNKTLDRIYSDSYKGKDVSKETFINQIKKKYGDPFSKSLPIKAITKTTPIVSANRAPADTTAVKAAISPADTNHALPVDKSLNGQYQYLLTKVYHYQQPLIAALWKNALDSLQLNQSKLKAAQNKLTIQNKTIDSLNNAITSAGQIQDNRNGEINLMGIIMSKTAYNLLVWGLVIVFGVTAFVVVSQSGSYRREAKYRTKLYTELEDEFKAHKTKANEKEKKLARELQTERNKLDDLLGKK